MGLREALEPALEAIPNPFEEEYPSQPVSALPAIPDMWMSQCSDRMVYAMSTEAIRSDWVGRVIDGRFPLLEWLGGSESGGVFLTELPEQRARKAAIKLMLVDARDEEAHLAGWAATTALSHPHLMRLFYTGRCQVATVRLFYVVTEFAGENLSQILPERPLTSGETREMLGPVFDALSYLHAKGLVHGRLKPSNIMVVDDRVKLSCDTLRVAGGLGRYFPAKTVYDSPQGVSETITPAADLWSLGITLVETLTQKTPVWDRTTHKEPVVPESMPEPFAGIARECLQPDLERRCTLGAVKAHLQPTAQPIARPAVQPVARPVALPAAQSVPRPAGPASEKGKAASGKLRMAAIVAALLVLLGAGAVLQLRPHPPEASPAVSAPPPAAASASIPPESPVAAPPASKTGVVKGEVVQRVLPDVSQGPRDTIRVTIVVVVRAKVDASGAVSDAALDVPPVSRFFGNQAVQSARNWRFKPAQVDGRAVPSEWLLHFEFAQAGIDASADETAP